MMPQVIHDYLAQLEDLIVLAKSGFVEVQADCDEGNRKMSGPQYLAAMAYCVNVHQAINELLGVLNGQLQDPPPDQEESPATN